jgi:hypothetical protein
VTHKAARPWRWLVAAVAWCAAAAPALAAAAPPLSVPYLPQSEDLCGGAAAAMVMRYWGASDVSPDTFQPLVDHRAGGIRTGALTDDLRRRGWTAVAGSGDAADILQELGRGRPIITLIQDSPNRYHYVVVVGWDGSGVTLHDPARAPSRVMSVARFDDEWRKSGRWMLIVLPPATLPSTSPSAAEPPPVAPDANGSAACARLVSDGVARADVDRGAARTLLMRATGECPRDAAAWRELAGVDALDGDWASAAGHAQRAIALAPEDGLAWKILATADYLRHDDLAALQAWNRAGEPAVTLIDVTGLDRTRYGVIADAIGVPLKSILTPEALRLAERRVRDVPAVTAARIAFHPVAGGGVQIDASVLERDRAPWGYPAWLGTGFDAAVNRQLSATFSSLTGGGEAAGVTWRWWEHRPMVSGFFAAPAPRSIGGGTLRLDASRETQAFGTAALSQTRSRVAMTLGNWLTGRTRVSASAGVDRWSDRAGDVTLSSAVEHRRWADRVRFAATLMQALGSDPFTVAAAAAGVRTNASDEGTILSGDVGYSLASRASPVSVWPGADTGQARDILLRAHPLLDDGIVTGGVFGRRVSFANVEAQRWRRLRRAPVRIAPAFFVDAARATSGFEGTKANWQVDAGAGVRLALPGAGTLRVDLAHGLRDGRTALSAGFEARWR